MTQELIEKIKSAQSPSRELDREILFAVMPKARTAIFDGVKHVSTMTAANGDFWFTPLKERDDCPHYTGSLDDAVELVPKDLYWHIGYGKTRDDEPLGAAQIISPESLETIAESEASTATLALCAVALRARALSIPSTERGSA